MFGNKEDIGDPNALGHFLWSASHLWDKSVVKDYNFEISINGILQTNIHATWRYIVIIYFIFVFLFC